MVGIHYIRIVLKQKLCKMKLDSKWIVFLTFSSVFVAIHSEIVCYENADNDIKLECKHSKYYKQNEIFDDYKTLNRVNFEQNGCDSEYYLEDARIIRIQCLLPYVPFGLFFKLKNAEKIEMNHAELRKIEGKYFPEDSNLKILKMKFNNLTSLEPNLCLNTRQMKEVDFSYNQISHVDEMAFAGCENSLEKIILESNSITSISFGNTDPFRCLSYINLEGNEIVQLDCDSFPTTKAWNGPHLNFFHNKLEKIDLKCDKHFHSLILNIDHNNLKNITIPASEMMKNLQELSVKENQISSISIQMNMDNLKVLNISMNNLEDISDISRCLALEVLDVSYNYIELLDASSFYRMSHLQQLNLTNNNVSEIGRGTFSYQRNLTELDLSHNKLKKISLDLFLPYFDNLTTFYLNNNNLTEIIGWDKALFPNLKSFAISENYFDCKYLERFLRKFKSRSIYLTPSSSLTPYSSDTNSVYGISCVDIENEVNSTIKTNEIRIKQRPTTISNDQADQIVSLLNQISDKLENIKL